MNYIQYELELHMAKQKVIENIYKIIIESRKRQN